MFNNIMELVELIESGKSNEEIINERLEYINSDEYKAQRKQTQILRSSIVGEESKAIMFHDGFIAKNMQVGLGNAEHVTCYVIDDINDLYDKLINYIRDNKEEIKKWGGIPLKIIACFVQDYFNIPKSQRDSDAMEMLVEAWKKEFAKNPNMSEETVMYKSQSKAREQIGRYISDWAMAKSAKVFDGDLSDFIKLWLYGRGTEEFDKVAETLYNIKSDEELLSGATLDISSIAGFGIAMCTEYAMLTQNLLSFLGYETYMLEGRLGEEEHNFNVIRKNGKYYVIDTLNGFNLAEIESMAGKEPEDLTSFGELEVIKQFEKDGKTFGRKYVLKSALSKSIDEKDGQDISAQNEPEL